MNSIYIALGAFLLYFLGYRFYARFVERQLDIDPDRPTPAHTQCDGVDCVPAKNWFILFGHHFSSIAGAAPVVGPILALSKSKPILYTVIPAIFMLVTAIAALVIMIKDYLRGGQTLLLIIAVTLFALAAFILYEALKNVRRRYA